MTNLHHASENSNGIQPNLVAAEIENSIQKEIAFDVDDPSLGFTMTYKYEILHRDAALFFNSNALIYFGEILTIVALPGSGKSITMEIIGCAFIAAKHKIKIDTLNISFAPASDKIALIIDTERTHDDSRRGFERMYRRIGHYPGVFDEETGTFNDLVYKCLISTSTAKERKAIIQRLVENLPIGLLILDGILDFSEKGLNDDEESNQLIQFIRALANQYDFAVITTIHPNKGTDTMAGHLGAFLYRYSRACMLIKSHDYDKNTKVMTFDFPQGKHSHCERPDNVYFTWDEEQKTFVQCEEPDRVNIRYDAKTIKEIFNTVYLSGRDIIEAGKLRDEYSRIKGIKPDTAKRHIIEAAASGLLTKDGNGKSTTYKLL